MLTGEFRWSIYRCSLYYSYNFSIGLIFFKIIFLINLINLINLMWSASLKHLPHIPFPTDLWMKSYLPYSLATSTKFTWFFMTNTSYTFLFHMHVSLTYHSRPAGRTIGGLPSATSPFGDAFGCRRFAQSQSCPRVAYIQPLIDWRLYRPGPLSPTQRSSAGHPASEHSVEPTKGSTRQKHSLWCPCAQSTPFPSLPPGVGLKNTPSQASCTVLPISESASWGPSYGNNVMTILQVKETEP